MSRSRKPERSSVPQAKGSGQLRRGARNSSDDGEDGERSHLLRACCQLSARQRFRGNTEKRIEEIFASLRSYGGQLADLKPRRGSVKSTSALQSYEDGMLPLKKLGTWPKAARNKHTFL